MQMRLYLSRAPSSSAVTRRDIAPARSTSTTTNHTGRQARTFVDTFIGRSALSWNQCHTLQPARERLVQQPSLYSGNISELAISAKPLTMADKMLFKAGTHRWQ
jgi:hypothetical protein